MTAPGPESPLDAPPPPARSGRLFVIAALVATASAIRLALPNDHVHGDPGFWLAAIALLGASPVLLVTGSLNVVNWWRARHARRRRTDP